MNALQFEVNGLTYFLSFIPTEGKWYLLTPTPSGIDRLAVADDAAPFFGPVVVESGEEEKKIVN